MANPFVHVELLSTDIAAAQTFYGEVFDWTFRDIPRPTNPYTLIDVGPGVGGNVVVSPIAETRPSWLPYVQITDIAGTLDAVRRHGGTIVKDTAEEPGAGSFAIIADPVGVILGLWQLPSAD